MYQSSSESSIEHGNFPSVINLHAVGESPGKHSQIAVMTKASAASQTYSTASSSVQPRGDPFLALATASRPYPQNQFNDDEVSYASSSMYSALPTISIHPGKHAAAMASLSIPISSITSYTASHDRQGSCGSPQSSDSESQSERQANQRRSSSSSTSTSSSEELRPAAFKTRIWKSSANASGMRKPLVSQSSASHRTAMNIIGSPSPSSNTVSSGGSNIGRHSLISQFSSATGRIETALVETIAESIALQCTGVADSGISNTSPETQSSTEFHTAPAATASAARRIDEAALRSGLRSSSQRQQCQQLLQLRQPASPQGILKQPADPAAQHSLTQAAFKTALCNILSCIYGILLCCLGALLPLTVLLTRTQTVQALEGFHVFLYLTGTCFIGYFYAFLTRADAALGRRQRLGAAANNSAFLGSPRASAATRRRAAPAMTSYAGTRVGSFYLRLGVIGFGIVTMLRDGIWLASALQHGSRMADCAHPIRAARAALAIVFTFVQFNFIFMNAKMCIHKNKALARLGLAHLVATNLCVWLRTVMNADGADLGAEAAAAARNSSGGGENGSLACASETDQVLQGLVTRGDPYLFASSVQYCLLASVILSFMWRNVGRHRRRAGLPPPGPASLADSPEDFEQQRCSGASGLGDRRSGGRPDCSGSQRGLFLGLAAVVWTAVTLLASAVLAQRAQFSWTGGVVSHCGELALLAAALAACLAAFPRTADLLFVPDRRRRLDEGLQLGCLAGASAYWLGSALTSLSRGPHELLCAAAHPLQATAQTAFLCTATRRLCYKALHEREKPGRELVTFLLVCNAALLAYAVAEPMRWAMAGRPSPTAIERVAFPLHCMYRLHSAVLLAGVWKDAYKSKAG